MLFVVLCPGTPEGSTGSGSGFKASQKTGQRLKVSSDRLGEAGNRTCDPWFTRHRFIPYTTAASLVNTKWWRVFEDFNAYRSLSYLFQNSFTCNMFTSFYLFETYNLLNVGCMDLAIDNVS